MSTEKAEARVEALEAKADTKARENQTMANAACVSKCKKEFDALTAELALCRENEKRLLQEQAKALNAFKAAQQKLLKDTVEE